MALPAFVRPHAEGVYLAVKLQPRASSNEIVGVLGGELRIKVTAPPVEAAANEALLRLLADLLDCPRGALCLARGSTSRHKLIQVRGLTANEVSGRLGKWA
jgi:uncharacterized protein